MGPPHERGGKRAYAKSKGVDAPLQWGRRMNAAESFEHMPREDAKRLLQWGRRMNAAESSRSYFGRAARRCGFNGAAA